MTLTEYLAEIKERADAGAMRADDFGRVCKTDIPTLLAIFALQARQLNQCVTELITGRENRQGLKAEFNAELEALLPETVKK